MRINNITTDIQQSTPEQKKPFFMTKISLPTFGAHAKVDEFVKLYTEAIQKNDVPLLKRMIEERNWQGFYDCKAYIENFAKEMMSILTDGIYSTNQKIKDLFNDKNLFNLAKQYKDTSKLASEYGSFFHIAQIYFSNTQDEDSRKSIVEEIYNQIHNNIFNKSQNINKISQFPMSDLERYYSRGSDNAKREHVHETMKLRLQRIVSKNGDNTPEELLNCLNDLIMSPEILGIQYNDSRLIDKIANIPVNDENKEVISKIAQKLAKMELPDNKILRNAGIIAARNGNAELLKVFDSKHIYYKTLLQEPVKNFPQNVQEILDNAKINDETLTSYADNPEELEKYLAEHPNTGINSKDKNGETLAIKAVQARNLKTLELLAKHDDFDWNMLDKNRNNLLTQMLEFNSFELKLKKEYYTEFVEQLLQLLRELPRGKFNINHTNYAYFDVYLNKIELRHFCFFTECPRDLRNDIIAFEDFNPNLKLTKQNNSLIEDWASKDFKIFNNMLNHPNTDISPLLDPITIKKFEDKLEKWSDDHFSRKEDSNLMKSLQLLTSQGIDMEFVKDTKKIYDKNGMLDLNEIERFVNYSQFNNVKHTKFNIADENIAHLLVDISPDATNLNEIMDYMRVFEKIKQADFDFNLKDIMGRTPLEKAIESQNQVAINILTKYQTT